MVNFMVPVGHFSCSLRSNWSRAWPKVQRRSDTQEENTFRKLLLITMQTTGDIPRSDGYAWLAQPRPDFVQQLRKRFQYVLQ